MTVQSGMFRSDGGDRRYKAEFFASYFASFIGNGVFPNPSTGLQVVADTNRNTIIKSGKGWINGYYVINTSDYNLTHDIADGVLSRIDRVVMRLNFSTRAIEFDIKKGYPTSTPTAPVLQRDNDIYELALADVYINKGLTVITQANITDQRLNNNLCGIVHGVVDQVDTTTIFNQFQSWYNQITVEKTDEYDQWFQSNQQYFLDWFEDIQDILDGDVAGNLLMLIQQNQTDIRNLIKHKTNVTVLSSGWQSNGEYFEYTITDTDISASSIVDVNIQLNYLDYAKMVLSACESFNGYIKMYSKSALDHDLVVDYRITKQVI